MVWVRFLLSRFFFSRGEKKREVLIYDPLSDNSEGLCQIRKPFLPGVVQSGWQREGTGEVIDAKGASSPRVTPPAAPGREEPPVLWAIHQVALGLFTFFGEISPPEEVQLAAFGWWCLLRALRTHGCLQEAREKENGKGFSVISRHLGCHRQIHTVQQTQRAEEDSTSVHLPRRPQAPAFRENKRYWGGGNASSAFLAPSPHPELAQNSLEMLFSPSFPRSPRGGWQAA